jgi:hypothetical protein
MMVELRGSRDPMPRRLDHQYALMAKIPRPSQRRHSPILQNPPHPATLRQPPNPLDRRLRVPKGGPIRISRCRQRRESPWTRRARNINNLRADTCALLLRCRSSWSRRISSTKDSSRSSGSELLPPVRPQHRSRALVISSSPHSLGPRTCPSLGSRCRCHHAAGIHP